MRRLFQLKTGRTQIVDLMSMRTIADTIAECRGGYSDGADGIGFELYNLDPKERNAESFKKVIDSVPLPFMMIFYRHDARQEPLCDEARQEILLAGLEAGVGMIDVMGDLFDKSPDERTRDPEAIRKQEKLISEIHAKGGQVVMSSHPQRFMKAQEIADQLQDFEQRGADVVKIVTVANTPEEYAENVRGTMLAWKVLHTPFIHLCGGKFARLQRFHGLSLGCAITFGVHAYHAESGYYQPLIREFRAYQDTVKWTLDSNIEK